MTTIDGVDIHFIHVRSRHPNALPLIITHGWPGSVIEQSEDHRPAHGSHRARRACRGRVRCRHSVLAGLRLLRQASGAGWDPDHIARAWAELMKRLGYTRYVAQGGDWGTPISSAMARQAPRDCSASTSTCRRRCRPRWPRRSPAAGPRRRDSPRRSARCSTALDSVRQERQSRAYFAMLTARPQTIGYGVTDSPAGLAAWMLVHPGFARWTYGADPEQVADERRRAGRHHAVLVDEQRDLGRAAVLGERRSKPDCCGRVEDRARSRCRWPSRYFRRMLSRPGDLGPPRLSQPDLLPRGRQGRTLRRLGSSRSSSVPSFERRSNRSAEFSAIQPLQRATHHDETHI